MTQCLICGCVNPAASKFCADCGEALRGNRETISNSRPASPSFGSVLGTTWKVFMAILLIIVLLGFGCYLFALAGGG